MKTNTTQKWIIGVGNSKTDTVHINQATGTEGEIRELLIKLVEKDKKTDITSWQYGTEDPEKLQRSISGILAYGRYEYYRITYQAIPLTDIPDIGEQSIIQNEVKQTEEYEELIGDYRGTAGKPTA